MNHFRGRDTPANDLKGDLNPESDCEDDSTGTELETPETKEEKEEETRAVLITGRFHREYTFSPQCWH